MTAATDTGRATEEVDLADLIDRAMCLAGDIRPVAMTLGPQPPPGQFGWLASDLDGMTVDELSEASARLSWLLLDAGILLRELQALAARLDAAGLAKEKAGELAA